MRWAEPGKLHDKQLIVALTIAFAALVSKNNKMRRKKERERERIKRRYKKKERKKNKKLSLMGY